MDPGRLRGAGQVARRTCREHRDHDRRGRPRLVDRTEQPTDPEPGAPSHWSMRPVRRCATEPSRRLCSITLPGVGQSKGSERCLDSESCSRRCSPSVRLAVLAVPASASVPAANAKFCTAANSIGDSSSSGSSPRRTRPRPPDQGLPERGPSTRRGKVKTAMNNIAKYLGLRRGRRRPRRPGEDLHEQRLQELLEVDHDLRHVLRGAVHRHLTSRSTSTRTSTCTFSPSRLGRTDVVEAAIGRLGEAGNETTAAARRRSHRPRWRARGRRPPLELGRHHEADGRTGDAPHEEEPTRRAPHLGGEQLGVERADREPGEAAATIATIGVSHSSTGLR